MPGLLPDFSMSTETSLNAFTHTSVVGVCEPQHFGYVPRRHALTV